MKKLFILGNFLLLTLALSAQNDYFLFIQSENNQPYYVQTDGKTLSSSAIGHLIIPGLKDSVYALNIGFPKSQFPEQVFQVRINRKDGGYQLKNIGADGWVLFNIQTLQLIKAQPASSKKQTINYGDIKKSDVFSTLMAGLVNDSAVLYTSIAKADPVKESSKTSISDTQPLPNEITRTDPVPKNDSITRVVETARQETPPKADSTLIKSEVVQKEEVPTKDTVAKMDIAVKDQVSKEDTASARTNMSKVVPLVEKDTVLKTARDSAIVDRPAVPSVRSTDSLTVVEQKASPDTAARVNVSIQPEKKPADIKPLIVWFSETKMSSGTELVYYDMSSPDRIDTIKIFIQKEEGVVETPVRKERNDTVENQQEEPKKGNGKFFGKLFGKKTGSKDPADGANTSNSNAKESSIKVTTVEDKKTDSRKETQPESGTAVKPEVAPEAHGDKSSSGNFLGKIFGKKNRSKAETDETNAAAKSKEASIKVTTVEEKKPEKKEGVPPQNTSAVEPGVTPATTAKESDTKDRSGNFFERVFSKKNKQERSGRDSGVNNSGNASTIKVTTVEKNRNSDSALASRQPASDQTDAEVEKLRKAQEKEERTSTQRFVGKLFGRRSKNEIDQKKASEQTGRSVKVTTVEKNMPVDTREKNKPLVTNSDCRDFASDYDVDKLRVRMLGEKDADGQVTEARKTFKSKCFTTSQVKSLSTLFRTDEGRYKLLDAAYPFVSDSGNFKDLISLLSDEYYINRFKAMVRM